MKKIIPVAFEFEMEWLRIRMKNIKNIDTDKPNLKALSIIEYSFLPTYLFLMM